MKIFLLIVVLACLVENTIGCNRESTSNTQSRDLLDSVTLLTSNCGQTTETYGFIMSSHSTQGRYDYFNQTVDCLYTITAKGDFTKVMVDFRWYDIAERFGTNENCSHASLWLYDGTSSSAAVLSGDDCGTVRPSVIESTGTSMTIRVVSDGQWSVIDFRAVFTAFNSESDCMSSDFMCSTTKRCISKEVTCDRQNISNCGAEDYSDQSDGSPSFCPVDEPADLLPLWITLGVLGALSPFIIYWCCWRPGYLAWVCGCCRRRHFSKKPCSCWTKHSKYFCNYVCSGAICAGCDCSDDSTSKEDMGQEKRKTTPKSNRETTALNNVFIVVGTEDSAQNRKNHSSQDMFFDSKRKSSSKRGVFLDGTGSPVVFSKIDETSPENESLEPSSDLNNSKNNSLNKKDNSKPTDNEGVLGPRPGLGRRDKVLYEPESSSGTSSPRNHRRPPYRISPMPPQNTDDQSDTISQDGSFPSSQSLPSALVFTSNDSTPTTGRRVIPPRKGVFLKPTSIPDAEVDNGPGGHVREGR